MDIHDDFYYITQALSDGEFHPVDMTIVLSHAETIFAAIIEAEKHVHGVSRRLAKSHKRGCIELSIWDGPARVMASIDIYNNPLELWATYGNKRFHPLNLSLTTTEEDVMFYVTSCCDWIRRKGKFDE